MNNALDYISIKGFRSIREIEKLELRPINILIGANGCGKSNFVDVFSFLNSIRQGKLRGYVEQRGGANTILHFGSRVTSEIEITLSFQNGVNGYDITLATTDLDTLYVKNELTLFWNKQYNEPYKEPLNPVNGEAGISQPYTKGAPKWVQGRLDGWQIYHFHDTSENSPIKKNSDINDNRILRPDGSNLPAYLLFLKTCHSDSYQIIRKIIQRVTPFFEDFRLEPSRLNETKIRLEWIHKSSPDQYFDVASLSDGSLRFICLATLLLQPESRRPSTILLDEPELGLHPYAITMLANMIQSAAMETQVIMSTQSSLLLDHFEPEDVLVAELQSGATTLRRLQSSELAIWLEDYSLGQLWEKNQFGGRPKNG
jgi:predicted ATPase